MIEFNILTIFPEMFENFTSSSICTRAISSKLIDVNLYNFRDYTLDKHKRVDDYPFGGGAGMLIAPQPVFDCFSAVHEEHRGGKELNVYMSPCGKVLDMPTAKRLSGYDRINILCGHYEGIDQRIIDNLIDEEISIGDYVLTGGELPAMVLMDCVMRHIKGVLGNGESTDEESFSENLLEYPQYTRPFDFRGMRAPEILLSGHHANIKKWQHEMALEKTKRNRPDLLHE